MLCQLVELLAPVIAILEKILAAVGLEVDIADALGCGEEPPA